MIKIALLETIEALVSAIKSKFLTKTEAKSIYQPKASAINTSNIGSQSVSYASSANSASTANSADSLTSDYFSTPTGRCLYYKSRYDKDLPAESAVIHMGAYAHENCTHEVAFCNDGALYTRYMSNGTWQSWTRMAKASEIPDVSGFATEDWVTSNYFNLQEMNDNYYSIGDVDSMLDNYLPKSGGTVTGILNTKDIVLRNGAIYAGSTSTYIIRYDTDSDGKQTHTFGSGAKRVYLGDWFYVDRMACHYEGSMQLNGRLAVGGIDLTFDTSNNTLNFSGGDGQTVHIAVNGEVIA